MAQAKINIERFDGKSDFNILNKKKNVCSYGSPKMCQNTWW